MPLHWIMEPALRVIVAPVHRWGRGGASGPIHCTVTKSKLSTLCMMFSKNTSLVGPLLSAGPFTHDQHLHWTTGISPSSYTQPITTFLPYWYAEHVWLLLHMPPSASCPLPRPLTVHVGWVSVGATCWCYPGRAAETTSFTLLHSPTAPPTPPNSLSDSHVLWTSLRLIMRLGFCVGCVSLSLAFFSSPFSLDLPIFPNLVSCGVSLWFLFAAVSVLCIEFWPTV